MKTKMTTQTTPTTTNNGNGKAPHPKGVQVNITQDEAARFDAIGAAVNVAGADMMATALRWFLAQHDAGKVSVSLSIEHRRPRRVKRGRKATK